MSWRARLGAALLVALAVAAPRSQDAPVLDWTYYAARPDGDWIEHVFTGLRYRHGPLEIRAERALALVDRQEFAAMREELGEREGLPRRTTQPPPARRSITEELLRERLRDFLAAVRHGRQETPAPQPAQGFALGAVHSLYLEGDVVIVRDGIEIARAARVHLSLVDDRAVFENAELRLRSVGRRGQERTLVVRGPRVVRQGLRTTGRDLSLTTCTAGEPHFEVIAGEAEIIQRAEEFEVRVREPHLAFSGVRVLPLPNMSFFTGDQSQIPVRGATASYSDREGFRGQVDLGGSYNETGGAVHHWLTGRPREEFRGDWNLGLGWIEKRGFPIEGEATYRADGLYEGRVRQFAMDDDGPNIREIRTHLDGTPIEDRGRRLTHTENRIELGENTRLDLTLFHATDPAVLSEFYAREYREDEIPETSAHFRHADRNRLFTATGRFNTDSFAYADDRSLTGAFREERPLATFDWFSERLATLPGKVPLLVTSSATIGELRSDHDPRFATPLDDETFRVTEELELSAPFRAGAIGVRPFASAQFAHFDHTAAGGGSRQRWSFAAGARAGTHLARSWSWTGDDGQPRALRHVVSPTVAFVDRFQVDGDPLDFWQFDEIDALDERAEIRIELLNRLQRRVRSPQGDSLHEFVWLDLAQIVTPISRDNAGHHLGLFEFELILRPAEWIPVPGLQMLVEGEQDWNDDELRTFNTGVRFGRVLGLNWFGEYRTDRTTDGTIGYGASTQVFQRWELTGGGQYDIDRSESLSYTLLLARDDHDWRIQFGLDFDVVTDDTSVFVNFEPTLGGLIEPRRQRHLTRQRLFGGSEFF
jgi:hypothetical protein